MRNLTICRKCPHFGYLKYDMKQKMYLKLICHKLFVNTTTNGSVPIENAMVWNRDNITKDQDSDFVALFENRKNYLSFRHKTLPLCCSYILEQKVLCDDFHKELMKDKRNKGLDKIMEKAFAKR